MHPQVLPRHTLHCLHNPEQTNHDPYLLCTKSPSQYTGVHVEREECTTLHMTDRYVGALRTKYVRTMYTVYYTTQQLHIAIPIEREGENITLHKSDKGVQTFLVLDVHCITWVGPRPSMTRTTAHLPVSENCLLK
jgi:hypothetical protein